MAESTTILARLAGLFRRPQASAVVVRSSDADAWDRLFGTMRSRLVSPETAMTHAAVYRCVFLISGAVAMIPFKTYRREADGDRQPARDGNVVSVLVADRPNPRMSPSTFWRSMAAEMLLEGNAIAWIQRKGNGQPFALWPVPWQRVRVELVGNDLIYTMMLDDGTRIRRPSEDVLHIPGSPQWMITHAASPIQAFSNAVGLGIEANEFAKRYFENDATPPGYIGYPNALKSTEQADEIRKYWKLKFGGANRFSGPAVLTDGGEYKQLKISAADAQLLESRKYQVQDIARIFGVPPHMIGDVEKSTSWGTGIEEQTQGFVDFTLGPHLKAIEDEIDWKLHGTRAVFSEFDREALVRGNLKTRLEAYRLALGGSAGPGFMTPNEVRRKLNLPNLPGGDELTDWTQSTSSPADPAAEPPADPANTPPADPEAGDGGPTP